MALKDDEESDTEIQLKVLEAQRQSVKLPFIRKVAKNGVVIPVNGEQVKLDRGQTIICDIVSFFFRLYRGWKRLIVFSHEASGTDQIQ